MWLLKACIWNDAWFAGWTIVWVGNSSNTRLRAHRTHYSREVWLGQIHVICPCCSHVLTFESHLTELNFPKTWTWNHLCTFDSRLHFIIFLKNVVLHTLLCLILLILNVLQNLKTNWTMRRWNRRSLYWGILAPATHWPNLTNLTPLSAL